MSIHLDGGRQLPVEDRNFWGQAVREAWVRWAETQPNPKASWLVPYEQLSEIDKEADRQIGEHVARLTLLMDAARLAKIEDSKFDGTCIECGNPTRFAVDRYCDQCEWRLDTPI